MDAVPGKWMSMERWPASAAMERPGYVFELENRYGMTIQMHWDEEIILPFDWTSPPLRFRLIVEAEAERSGPIPPPATRQ